MCWIDLKFYWFFVFNDWSIVVEDFSFFEIFDLLNLLKIALILNFFFQIETIRNDVLYFIALVTDKMKVIRAFTLLFVSVFSTIACLWLVIKRVFIISFLVFFSIFELRRLEVWRTIVKRRLNVDCFLHVILQTICQNQQFFLDDE
jgi:hypothetical protein